MRLDFETAMVDIAMTLVSYVFNSARKIYLNDIWEVKDRWKVKKPN